MAEAGSSPTRTTVRPVTSPRARSSATACATSAFTSAAMWRRRRAIIRRRAPRAQEVVPRMRPCDTCSTPLSDEGRCVTCEAGADGLALVTRTGYAAAREVMGVLELEGLGPEMEKVPPGKPEEAHHPLWNLYVPKDEL